jgi:hypothetical protein
VNSYLAHKQHLLPASQVTGVVQATRDIVALHATDPIGPYLSLWARVPDFQRGALRALAAHGYAQDPRFAPLLERFLSRQDEQGRWPCGSVSRTWPLEKRNRPSKWVTLDALQLLRTVGNEQSTPRRYGLAINAQTSQIRSEKHGDRHFTSTLVRVRRCLALSHVTDLLLQECEQVGQVGKAPALAGARALQRSPPEQFAIDACLPQAQQIR